MGVLLGLLSAVCYGTSDFAAGLGGRRGNASAVTVIAQPFGLLAAIVAVAVVPGDGPTAAALWWGALSGAGSGVGTIALYRGLSTGRMSVVAPLSAVLAAALPAVVGFALGDHLPALAWAGIVVALPAIVLVSSDGAGGHGGRRAAVIAGLVAGAGFAVLFIGLARAGTDSGAWPLLPGQMVAVLLILGVSLSPPLRPDRAGWRPSLPLGAFAGVLAGIASIAYLAATGHGQLAVIAVLTSLYPAITVVLARIVVHERWERLQSIGMLVAVLAVVLISTS